MRVLKIVMMTTTMAERAFAMFVCGTMVWYGIYLLLLLMMMIIVVVGCRRRKERAR